MSNQNIEYRQFVWDDLQTVVHLVNRSDAADGLDRGTSETMLRAQWSAPGAEPTRNAFLVTVGLRPVAFGRVDLRAGDQQSGFSKFQCFGRVLPDWRRQGIGSRILAECENRARARLGEAPTRTVYLEAYADRRQEDVAALFASCGLAPKRYFFDMVCEGADIPHGPGFPPGYRARTFKPGQDEEAMWLVLDTSFRDHWGHTPFSLEHWLHWIHTGPFDPFLALLAVGPAGKAVGECLGLIDPESNRVLGREEGWIDSLGVLREHRGRGVGRALLLEGMRHLRQRGCTHLMLGVDTENPWGALGLYESVGFRRWRVGVAYQKLLRG